MVGSEKGEEFTLPASIADESYIESYIENQILNIVIEMCLNGSIRRGLAVYLPASRTGLMLAFPALISQVLGTLTPPAAPAPQRTVLPLTITSFLQSISYSYRFKGGNTRLSWIADWVESRVLEGKIVSKGDGDVPTFLYEPTSAKAQIPLHATSSMISELTPFLMILRSGFEPSSLVFEEPEAHLHLSAQLIIARAIARIVNAGVNVVVTTHSDSFVQQINNLIQLQSDPRRSELLKEYDYDPADTIRPDDVIAYDFVSQGSYTHVVKLEKVKEGIVVPSLNETLINLAAQTLKLQEAQEGSAND